jgi:hypothetical protein
MLNNFENFLQEWFSSQNPQILDDDLSDKFNDWLAVLEYESYLLLGQQYGRDIIEKLIEDIPDYQSTSPVYLREKEQLRAKWLGKEQNA